MAVSKATVLALLCVAMFDTAAGDTLSDASVRVGGCSGTIIAVGKTWAYGISASHCIGSEKDLTATIPGGKKVKAQWISTDSNLDLVLFKIPAAGVSFVSVGKVSGTIVSRGLNGDKNLEFRSEGAIFDKETKKKYHRAEFKVTKGDFDKGDSGGGVFAEGKLCGVITHGEDDLLYAATYSQVLSFLAEQKSLSHSINTEGPDAWGDKDRTREIIELKKRLSELENKIAKLKVKDGQTGKPGPQGPAGRDGRDAIISSDWEGRLSNIEAWIKNFRAVVRVKLVPKEK